MNVAQYLPQPLIARSNEWISPVIITVRDLEQPALTGGIALGKQVLGALGMGDGFTHMEWFRSPTARWCSARSAAAPAARTSSTREQLGGDVHQVLLGDDADQAARPAPPAGSRSASRRISRSASMVGVSGVTVVTSRFMISATGGLRVASRRPWR
jgi:hypothetical protein